MRPLNSRQRETVSVWKWLLICSHFVSVIRPRPSFQGDEIIKSKEQNAKNLVS